jgi:cobyrinic acid a,c-diamide synthase
LPDVDALYFGGGFPEVHAERLAGNGALREAVRKAAASGMPIYAECGGLMFLARELIVGGAVYPMAGVLDLVVEQRERPQGHGYVEAEVDRPSAFFRKGTRLRGHEFHYSRVVAGADAGTTTLSLRRGRGVGMNRDGLVVGRVWASYVHLHALGCPEWAEAVTRLAREYRLERSAEPEGDAGGGRRNRETTDRPGAVGPGETRHASETGAQGVAAAGA